MPASVLDLPGKGLRVPERCSRRRDLRDHAADDADQKRHLGRGIQRAATILWNAP
jgi:hypothetical protein